MDRSPTLASLAALAKAERPDYLNDKTAHELLGLILDQAEELGVVKDRLKTAKLLGNISDAQIDAHILSEEETESRLAAHLASQEDLLKKLLEILNQS